MELSELSEPVFKTHPNTFFFIWLIAVNSVFLAGALYFLRKRAFYAILFILVIAFFTGITGVFIHSAFERTKQYGVVTEAVPVHKVPGELAADWFDLSEGTSLRILYQAEGFLFIQTGFGLTGWVRAEDVRPIALNLGEAYLP